jgi:hypothetical protein
LSTKSILRAPERHPGFHHENDNRRRGAGQMKRCAGCRGKEKNQNKRVLGTGYWVPGIGYRVKQRQEQKSKTKDYHSGMEETEIRLIE